MKINLDIKEEMLDLLKKHLKVSVYHDYNHDIECIDLDVALSWHDGDKVSEIHATREKIYIFKD